MKVLYFTKYTRLGASSRLRCYQYFPYLEKSGIEVHVSPLFCDQYLIDLYAKKKVSKLGVLKAYFKRFFKLFQVFSYDKIVIDDELFPYFPAWFEVFFSKLGVQYMSDYDDAVFHNYNLHSSALLRFFLGNKIATVMKNSCCVLAGNAYLADYAKKSGAKNVEIFPTVVDVDRYQAKSDFNLDKNTTLNLGWIGSASTQKYMVKIIPVLEKIAKEHSLKLYLIGTSNEISSTLDIVYLPWSEATEAENLQKIDVGFMPLDNSPWEQGKCGYKLIQYMASGIPVIASDVGVNAEIVKERKNGFLATEEIDWQNAIYTYLENRELLPVFGKEGRKIVVEKYNLALTSKLLINRLNGII